MLEPWSMLAIWPGSSWTETIFTHLIHPLNRTYLKSQLLNCVLIIRWKNYYRITWWLRSRYLYIVDFFQLKYLELRSQGCLYHLHLDYSWQRNKDDPTSHPAAQLVLAYRRHWRKTTWENYLLCLDCWLAALAEQSLDENKQKESWYSTIWNNCRAEYNAHVCWLSIGYLESK